MIATGEENVPAATKKPRVWREISDNNIHLQTLIACSEVNRKWNFEMGASSVPDVGDWVATIGPEDGDEDDQHKIPTCVLLENFIKSTSTTDPLLFTGLKIVFRSIGRTLCSCISKASEFYENLFAAWLDRMKNLKTLVIKWTNNGFYSCRSIDLVPLVLKTRSYDLEHLFLEPEIYNRISFATVFTEEFKMAKLKKLGLGSRIYLWMEDQDFVRKLLQAAPNLKQIYGLIHPLILKQKLIPQDKLSLVQEFHLHLLCDQDLEVCAEFVKLQPKLVNLSVEALPKNFVQFDQFWRICDRLLASSQTSLQQICFHYHDEFILDRFLLCVKNHALENLSNLGIIVQEECFFQLIKSLKSVNYLEIFPNLKRLTIIEEQSEEIILRMDDYLKDNNEDHEDNQNVPDENEEKSESKTVNESTTVDTLNIHCNLTQNLISDLKKTYPNITSLKVNPRRPQIYARRALPYKEIWTAWPDLEHLDILIPIVPVFAYNFDAVFCGISEAELKTLREVNAEQFLEKVHIVSNSPNLLSLRRLKTLQIRVEIQGPLDELKSAPFLSEVTGYLIFKRMTNTKIKILVPNEDARQSLKHLEKFCAIMVRGRTLAEEELAPVWKVILDSAPT